MKILSSASICLIAAVIASPIAFAKTMVTVDYVGDTKSQLQNVIAMNFNGSTITDPQIIQSCVASLSSYFKLSGAPSLLVNAHYNVNVSTFIMSATVTLSNGKKITLSPMGTSPKLDRYIQFHNDDEADQNRQVFYNVRLADHAVQSSVMITPVGKNYTCTIANY